MVCGRNGRKYLTDALHQIKTRRFIGDAVRSWGSRVLRLRIHSDQGIAFPRSDDPGRLRLPSCHVVVLRFEAWLRLLLYRSFSRDSHSRGAGSRERALRCRPIPLHFGLQQLAALGGLLRSTTTKSAMKRIRILILLSVLWSASSWAQGDKFLTSFSPQLRKCLTDHPTVTKLLTNPGGTCHRALNGYR